MSYGILTGNTEAQVRDNTLESIINETNELTNAELSVGRIPEFILSDYSDIYVANIFSSTDQNSTVSVIDPDTNIVIKNIPVGVMGEEGSFIALSTTSTNELYVLNSLSDTVSIIDRVTKDVTKNIDLDDSDPTFLGNFRGRIYVANGGSGTVSVIDPDTRAVIQNIPVGEGPSFIAMYENDLYVANALSNTTSVINVSKANNATTWNVTDTIDVGYYPTYVGIDNHNVYVANTGSEWPPENGTVSVIDPKTKNVTKTVTVGINPSFIGAFGDGIYVTNSGSNTVSVIDATTYNVTDITVGEGPRVIANFKVGDDLYVANQGSDTVSVINTTTNNVTKNIPVGYSPKHLAKAGDAIYVANSASDSVSIINPDTNEVVAGVTFDINPFGGGLINCDGLDKPIPINRYFYVASGTGCIAKPNNGYGFSSWVETFEGNSTKTVSASTTSGSLWTPFLDFFNIRLGDLATSSPFTTFLEYANIKSGNPAANLTVNKFGNFTAYFKELPPPVPAEFTVSLFTIVFTALVGSLLIPAAVGWFKSKKQTARLNSFHLYLVTTNKDGLDEKDISDLNKLNQNVSNSYSAGKITNEQYANLKNEVSAAYQKVFKKRIESLTDPNTEAVNKIKNDIEDAYSDGKIIELHYNLLNGKISRMFDNK